jgi:hypothetical protein
MSGGGGSLGEETPTGPTDRPGHPSQPGPRREVGSAADSRRHPPHVTENVEGEPVQRSMPSPGPAAPLPANAHGQDKSEQAEQPPIREESMYDDRPGENKDTPPSKTGGQ